MKIKANKYINSIGYRKLFEEANKRGKIWQYNVLVINMHLKKEF